MTGQPREMEGSALAGIGSPCNACTSLGGSCLLAFSNSRVSSFQRGNDRSCCTERDRQLSVPPDCHEPGPSCATAVVGGAENDHSSSCGARSMNVDHFPPVGMCDVEHVKVLVVGGQRFVASVSTLSRSSTLRRLLQRDILIQPHGTESRRHRGQSQERGGNAECSAARGDSHRAVDTGVCTSDPHAATSIARSIFIDRDPQHFQLVLEYLRNGQVNVREAFGGQEPSRELWRTRVLSASEDREFPPGFDGRRLHRQQSVNNPERLGPNCAASPSLVSLRREFDYFGLEWPSRCIRCDALFDPSRCQPRHHQPHGLMTSGLARQGQSDTASDEGARKVGAGGAASDDPTGGDGNLEPRCYYHPGQLAAVDLTAPEDAQDGPRRRTLDGHCGSPKEHLYYTCCRRREDAVGCQAGSHVSEEEALAGLLRGQSASAGACSEASEGLPAASSVTNSSCVPLGGAATETPEVTELLNKCSRAKSQAPHHAGGSALHPVETRDLDKPRGDSLESLRASCPGSSSVVEPAPLSSAAIPERQTVEGDSRENTRDVGGEREPPAEPACGAISASLITTSSLSCRAADSPNCATAEIAGGESFSESGFHVPQYSGSTVCSTPHPSITYPLAVQYSQQQAARRSAVWPPEHAATAPTDITSAARHGPFSATFVPTYSVGVHQSEGGASGTDSAAASMTLALCQSAAAAPRYPLGSLMGTILQMPFACPFYYFPGTPMPSAGPHGAAPANFIVPARQAPAEHSQVLHPQLHAQPQPSVYGWGALPASSASADAPQTHPHESLLACTPSSPASELANEDNGGAVGCPWLHPASVSLCEHEAPPLCVHWISERHHNLHNQCLLQEQQFQFQQQHFQQTRDLPPLVVIPTVPAPQNSATGGAHSAAVGDPIRAAERPRLTPRSQGNCADVQQNGVTDGEDVPRPSVSAAATRGAGSHTRGEPPSLLEGRRTGSVNGQTGDAGRYCSVPGEEQACASGRSHAASDSTGRPDGAQCVSLRRRRSARGADYYQPHIRVDSIEAKQETAVNVEQPEAPVCGIQLCREHSMEGVRYTSPIKEEQTNKHTSPLQGGSAFVMKEGMVGCPDDNTMDLKRSCRQSADCTQWGSWQSADIEDAPSLECGAVAGAVVMPDESLTAGVFADSQTGRSVRVGGLSGDADQQVYSTEGQETPATCCRVRDRRAGVERSSRAGDAVGDVSNVASSFPRVTDGTAAAQGRDSESLQEDEHKGLRDAVSSRMPCKSCVPLLSFTRPRFAVSGEWGYVAPVLAVVMLMEQRS
ncbi:zinc finger (CCCH type) motif-containing protein [Besnoitia besnoiti]|uniref:Zinc finger (CCCH type) motif-containing protein n=1 Tax=Besnoitia besnoiti TaxID=94643 RepID=A0A2A9MBJ8_BESBE|nr:zinc finger (CCCH type) motif-containing protein [Besnoitia besnoiti]PFH34594.1 zinc finger (CCCH type) motif-containing protein [Besnoitia besnoiti]